MKVNTNRKIQNDLKYDVVSELIGRLRMKY
jgi:hypothetical protein